MVIRHCLLERAGDCWPSHGARTPDSRPADLVDFLGWSYRSVVFAYPCSFGLVMPRRRFVWCGASWEGDLLAVAPLLVLSAWFLALLRDL